MSVVLSEHLPLLASAPDGIQKLRGLILELAVRGKLVPQDPNDEPASELLKRIAKERTRLEAAGSLKKSKAMPVVGEEEKLFDTPIGWEWARLATIGNIFNGNSINSNEKEAKFRRKDGLPYIATKDVGYGLKPLDYDNGICIPESEPNFKIAHEGAVFICAEGGSAGKKCGITDRNVFFGNKLFANEIFAGIPPRLVLYLYLSPFFREQFVAAMTGIIGGVSIAKFIEIAIPIPPLPEQHRIVAKVDELMALCDRLEAEQSDAGVAHARLVDTLLGTLTQSADAADLAAKWQRLAKHFDTLFITESSLDALKQTILQLAVMGKLALADANDESVSQLLAHVSTAKKTGCEEKLGRDWVGDDDQPIEAAFQAPLHWHWVRITEVVERVTVGYVGSMKSQYVEQGIPFLRSQNVRPNKFREDGLIRISPEFHRSIAKSALCPGDVVVVRSGSVGTACVIPPSLPTANCSDLVVVKKPIGVLPDFLCFYLNSLAEEHISAGTVGIALTHFNTKSVALMPIPLPPLAEQHRIVAKVDELMTLVDRLKADLAESRTQQDRLATTLIEAALKAA